MASKVSRPQTGPATTATSWSRWAPLLFALIGLAAQLTASSRLGSALFTLSKDRPIVDYNEKNGTIRVDRLRSNTLPDPRDPTHNRRRAISSHSVYGSIEQVSALVRRKRNIAPDLMVASNYHTGQMTSRYTNNNNNNNYNYNNQLEPGSSTCCACDEAKYELMFEGLWSKYTHPGEFPEDPWSAHFSDLIGASHSSAFSLWQENEFASEGVQELAQTGSTKQIEAELKQKSNLTRTVIKARELRYPSLNGKTAAVFRVDKLHHLVSVLAKIAPSPDWLVGVSGLDLCLPDCSWVGQRVVGLHLWDAGIDSGSRFEASASPSRPQERVHRIRVQAANSERPFEGADSQPITANGFNTKPYARLTITRQRIYDKRCDAQTQQQPVPPNHQHYQARPLAPVPVQAEPEVPMGRPLSMDQSQTPSNLVTADCRLTDWSDWSSCSVICPPGGRGSRTRTRSFVNELAARVASCPRGQLTERQSCLSECLDNNVECITTDWSEWSSCPVDCGEGIRSRRRSLIDSWPPLACGSIKLVEFEPCQGRRDCRSLDSQRSTTPGCHVGAWSSWSSCSVPCGKGYKVRTRKILSGNKCTPSDVYQRASCTKGKHADCRRHTDRANSRIPAKCLKAHDPGPCQARIQRWAYEPSKKKCVSFVFGGCLGNHNNFQSPWECTSVCMPTGRDHHPKTSTSTVDPATY